MIFIVLEYSGKILFTLEYYVDGELVRTISGKDIIDPNNYTGGTGLVKDMDIIINMEDQSWRAVKGLSPTDEELKNVEDHTFLVDWIRVIHWSQKNRIFIVYIVINKHFIYSTFSFNEFSVVI